MKVAQATQRPGQTKEQTKLVAQGVRKALEEYKKRQAAKTRELDRKLKQLNRQLAEQRSAPAQSREPAPSRRHWLPWLLLALSWAGFVGYLWWSGF
jgi:ferric-dicitrate binding protein FerR (iron transport regulator)